MSSPDLIETCCLTIRQVLQEFLTDKQAGEATTLWRQQFSKGPLVAIQPFVALVCSRYQLSNRRSALYFALMNQLSPLRNQQRAAFSPEAVLHAKSKEQYASQTFLTLLHLILNRVGAKDISKKYWLVEALHFPGVDRAMGVSTDIWQDLLLDGSQRLPFELSIGQMKALLLHVQRKLRDLLGIDNTELLLLHVLQDIEQLPCHQTFSARELL